MDLADYRYLVDWDNGPGQSPPVNPFLGTYDDISVYVLKAEWSGGSDTGQSGQTKAGSCAITLDNSSSLFSSYNTLSDIYGKILPGIRVRIQMKIGGGAWVAMWQGSLDSIVPLVGPMVTVSTAVLQAYGPLQQTSEDADVDIPMQTDIATGSAMELILDAAGFPSDLRDIDAGHSTMSRFWARKGKVLEILRELEEEETGLLRETKDGKIQFEDRGHRLAAPHTTPRSTYGTGTLRPWDLQQSNPLLDIYNSITASIKTFNKSELTTLATIVDVRNGLGGDPIPFANGETKVIDIEFPTPSSPSQFLAVETWGTVTVEINTNAAGIGTDITNTGITMTRQDLGRTLRCTFVNGSGSAGYFIRLLVDGVAIVEGDPLTVGAEDAASIAKFRKRAFPNPSQWLTRLSEGQDYCDHRIALAKDPRPALRFTLKANYDATHLAEAQAIDVSDRIHVTASLGTFGLALDADFFVEWLKHTVDEVRLHMVQVYCRAVVTHSWPASGTSYTPKVIPGAGTGSSLKVPDDLWVLGIVNGPFITFGGGAWKWNTDIDLGEFRALFVDSDDDVGYADLRTPTEGGVLVHDGATMFVVTGLAADWSGCQYSIDSPAQGRWYFAFRLHNPNGWSVWSDGNDTPDRVKDYRDTQPLDQQSDGPPEDWAITWKPGPTGHSIVASATRPLIHGATIWGVVVQVKDKSAGSWIAVDDASVTLYDGSAVAHTLSNNGKRLTRATGTGFGTAHVGSLILFDVRGGAFDQAHCQWGTISNYEGWNGTLATATVSASATWIEVQGKFRAWPITTLTDLRIKVVTPPWEWVAAGYFGLEPNRGLWAKWYIDPISGLEGDSTSVNFVSDPIDIPMATDLADIEVRYWFDNGYSRNDDNNYGTGATSSGLCIVLADTNPILTDAALDDGAPSKQFRVEVAGNRTLANPTNSICGQILRWCIINSTGSEITITLDDAFRVGKIVPEFERPYDKSAETEYLPGRITEDDAYDPTKAAVYFGNGDTDGTFRIIREGSSPPSGELLVQLRTGGTWVTVYTFASSP